jgi:hypothetical protein
MAMMRDGMLSFRLILGDVGGVVSPNGSGFWDSANAPAPENLNAMKGRIRRI